MICYLFPEPIYLFFSSDVPRLLYYAHIPTTVVALIVSLFVFWHGRHFLLNKLLLVISVSFSLWSFLNLIAWTNIHSDILLFIWPFFGVLSAFLAIFSVYFVYVFLEKKDVTFLLKSIFLVLLAPVLILASTYINIKGFNITNCDAYGFEGLLFKLYYFSLGLVAMIWILALFVRKYF